MWNGLSTMRAMNALDAPPAQRPPRERILLVAHDLFYGEGIRATGIDRIIEKSKVAKVTFYRQFPSKDDLVRAYLAYRHERWMSWLRSSLERHRARGVSPMNTLLATFEEWFGCDDFRGCAFLNSTAELGASAPDILEAVRQHKDDMAALFESLLPKAAGRALKARALAVAVDGAILHAQMAMPLASVLQALRALIHPIFSR